MYNCKVFYSICTSLLKLEINKYSSKEEHMDTCERIHVCPLDFKKREYTCNNLKHVMLKAIIYV
ncbi:uncharacterized protein DS421_17g585390 [Arachis hypogaea]|nr:uncharacterized protein DS421_17g585390 [Arachis hypogaea]